MSPLDWLDDEEDKIDYSFAGTDITYFDEQDEVKDIPEISWEVKNREQHVKIKTFDVIDPKSMVGRKIVIYNIHDNIKCTRTITLKDYLGERGKMAVDTEKPSFPEYEYIGELEPWTTEQIKTKCI